MIDTPVPERVVVLYESMFGATRQIAEAIGEQLRPFADVAVVNCAGAGPDALAGADLVVAGGPTHVFGLSSATTREEARKIAEHSDSGLVFEWVEASHGLRELLHELPHPVHPSFFAAFSTRSSKGPRLFTGSAARRIDRELRATGYRPLAAPRDFLVDATHRLVDGQLAEAAAWGAELAQAWGRDGRHGMGPKTTGAAVDAD
ncbi:hypothetical protein VD659_13555 [Herbiconiux sp. 11R-BC]|uniref:flavodoxin family protein n=1 Tax=Herbiconiux sp. 11R-BC TaxID=3111637 RepID=UPI003C0D5C02